MSFRFSLQKILDLRKREVLIAQENVFSTKSKIMQLKNMLEKERQLYFTDRDELSVFVKKMEFTQIKIYEKSLAIHQEKMMELLKNIRDLQNDLVQQEQILTQSKLNQKIIEKLYAMREKEYEKKEKTQEQYLLDEKARLGFMRNSVGEENEE